MIPEKKITVSTKTLSNIFNTNNTIFLEHQISISKLFLMDLVTLKT